MIRFWRWLTCGHGRHRWALWPTIPLDAPETGTWSGYPVLVRICLRCEKAWELE